MNRVLYKQPYICGDMMTLADLSAFSELRQYYIITNCNLELKYPNVYDWMIRMLEVPEFKEMDNHIMKLASFMKAMEDNYDAKL